MDAAGLLLSVAALVPTAAPWPGGDQLVALGVAAAALLVLAGGLVYRRRKRRALRRRGDHGPTEVRALKERLWRRLAEPAEAFAGAARPTLGAGEALEADLDRAANGVLPEAGWRRGAAKQLLRRHINGHAPNGRASNGAGGNGDEAARWRQLGALALIDDIHDALTAYARACALAPDDPDLQMLLGVLHLRAGNLEAADAAFRRQMGLADGKEEGATVRYRAGTMLGDVLLARGARAEALAAYEAACKEVLALAEREPANARWRRDASVAHDRIGDLLLVDGQVDLALESFRRSLEIAEALAGSDPASAALQHDLSVAHDRVGEALELKGDLDGALASYGRGLSLAETLIKQAPDRMDWRWDVSASLDRVGDVLSAKGKPDEALAAYRRALGIAQDLAVRDPTRIEWQRDLAVTCHKVGMLEAQCGREADAREALEQGKAIIARLAEIARYQAQWRADLSKFDAALRGLGP
jgi:tetratricopeptide (TPR) repeat protein